VLQDAQLFNGTIRENICYGINREVSDEEVEAAAKLACADGFIRELSGGYDFMIGENGNRLSGGQRQRIAIARAVMLDPGYLLLDEATCSMDVYSEQIVTDALFRLMEGRTTVLISHDMKILERADYIVVVNQGSIEAEGTVEAVKKSSPMLQSLLTANR
jgi:ATP-binding cassette subfamily B protein AbcA/BmrA